VLDGVRLRPLHVLDEVCVSVLAPIKVCMYVSNIKASLVFIVSIIVSIIVIHDTNAL
jgi:hypothetical protein